MHVTKSPVSTVSVQDPNLEGVVISRCDVRLRLSLMKDNGAPGLRTKTQETWWNSVSPRLFATAAGNADSLEGIMFFCPNGNFLMHGKILVSERISLRKKQTKQTIFLESSETAFKKQMLVTPLPPPPPSRKFLACISLLLLLLFR